MPRSAAPRSPALLLASNVLLAVFVTMGQAMDVSASHPAPTPSACAVDLPAAVAVHGKGRILVRWFGSLQDPLDPAPVNGQFPTFPLWRNKDSAGWVHVADVQRAPTAAEAKARLTSGGGDDTSLLVESAQRLNASFAQGAQHPYDPAVLLDALASFEEPSLTLAQRSLADRAWRIAWAMGLGWLDSSLALADTNHHFQYRVFHIAPGGGGAVMKATTQDLLYQHAPDYLAAPANVQAKTIDDLPAPETDPALQDGTDWDKVQRRRWMNASVALTWDPIAQGNYPCASSPDQNSLPSTVEFPVGYDIFRRPNCTLPNPPAGDPCTLYTKVNPDPVFPVEPEHEYNHSNLDANGNPYNNDTDPLLYQGKHVAFHAYFVDNSTELDVGKEYCYYVVARNLLGQEGLIPAEGCAYVIETIPPEPPRDFELVLVNNEVEARWSAPLGEPVARYEVWRTKVLRQDLLPEPGDPPNAQGTSADRWKLLATVVPAPAQTQFTHTDLDPTVEDGEHFWYKVRAFDDPPPGQLVKAFNFEGNPSAFTRPLSLGPQDLLPPMVCPPTFGVYLDYALGNLTDDGVPPGCFQIPFPNPQFLLPGQAGDGCIHLPAPVPQDARKVYWFQADDGTDDRLHLTKVFRNQGQTKYCNPLDLSWPMPLCVKVQAEDAVGNRGVKYPLGSGCYFPSFSDDPVPPPPKPVVTDASGSSLVFVDWAAPAPPWLARFHLYEHDQPELPWDCAGVPLANGPGATYHGPFQPTTHTVGFGVNAIIAYFTVIAENTEGALACSEPFAWQKDSTLPWAYHTTFPGQVCLAPSLGSEGVTLRFGLNQCGTGSTDDRWVVYRSLWPTHGFVPITPPLDHSPYTDRTAPDARYYYQVARVGLAPDSTGTIADGEVLQVSAPVQAQGPKGAWPATPASQLLCPLPEPGASFNIKELHFGDGPQRMTLEVCWHKNEPASPKSLGQLGLGQLKEALNLVPQPVQQGLQPIAQPVVQQGEQLAQALPDAQLQVLQQAPVTVRGAGLLKWEVPGAGARSYVHSFANLTVLPSGLLCCNNAQLTAKVLAGKVTQQGAPGLYPLPFGAEVGPGDLPFYRVKLLNITLDKDGAHAAMNWRAPEDVRFYRKVFNADVVTDELYLGVLNITAKVEWRKDFQVPNGPDPCAGQPLFGFDMVTLPLRLVPGADLNLTQGGMQPVPLCSQYRDPYVPGIGHPSRLPPTSHLNVDTNDGYLRAVFSGQGAVQPHGTIAQLDFPNPLVWVTAVPSGFRLHAEGAALQLALGRLVGGSVAGPVDVEASYRVDTGLGDVSAVERHDLHASFPGDLDILDGGALRGEGGTLDAADAAKLPWLNTAFQLHDVAGATWTLALGPVQTRGPLVSDLPSDDETVGDLMGPASKDATQLVAQGLNFLREDPAQLMTWDCLADSEPPLELPTEKVAINLRQSGFHQLVKASIDANAPVPLKVRGYDAELLYFQGVFLDSAFYASDVRIRVKLPVPADFDVLLLNAEVGDDGCVLGGDVPPGTVLLAKAWHLPLAPEVGEFRPSETFPLDANDPNDPAQPCHPAPEPEHCAGEYPHWEFWLLGWADLPHLQGPAPPSDIPKGFVPWDNAWTPEGQALAGFAVHPALRLDGFNFTASRLELSKALVVRDCGGVALAEGPGAQACPPGGKILLEEDKQPGAGWQDGNLGGAAPCAGVDPGEAAVRAGRCPAFLEYEGYLALPYWIQSAEKVQATAFVPGVRNQTSGGGLASQPMEGALLLGLREAPSFARGWTEASEVPEMAMAMWYARPPAPPGLDAWPTQPTDPFAAHEKGAFAGFAGGQSMGPTVDMNVGTIVSSLHPCQPGQGGGGQCQASEPRVEVLNGMAASPGVLRGITEVLAPGVSAPAQPQPRSFLAARLQPLLDGTTLNFDPNDVDNVDATPAEVDDVDVLLALWGQFPDCSDGLCYLEAAQIINQTLEQFQGDLGNSPASSITDPAIAYLEDEGGQEKPLVNDWDLGIGEMRSTIVWSKTAEGDFVFEMLILEVKFDERSANNYITAETLTFVVDRHGVVTLDAKGLVAKFLAFEAEIDIYMRFEATRFDGGVSIGTFQVGTIIIDYIHGVFGAGDNGGVFFYFGISGQGHEDGSSTTIGISLLFGTIDPISKPILQQHGFAELIEYLNTGEAAGVDRLDGIYARAYGQVPIYGSGCFFSLNAGAEIGFWFFDVQDDTTDGFIFGAKFRAFIVGYALCIVSIRGDMTVIFQDFYNPETDHHDITASGLGWVAGGLGLCDPETWTDWDDRFWEDDWCVICGTGLEFLFNTQDGWSVDYAFDCGMG